MALIGWIKAGPPQKPLLFWSCKLANDHNKSGFVGGPAFIQPIRANWKGL